MKQQNSTALFYVALLTTIFCSCQKNLEVKNGDSEVHSTPLPGHQTYCRIESIWEHPNSPDQSFHLIHYDEYENPIDITGVPYQTFTYDQWHRLREYKLDYGNGIFGLHYYGYDNAGRIGVDTNYLAATSGEYPQNYFLRQIITFTYDAENRIIQTFIKSNKPGPVDTGPAMIIDYSYDTKGNLTYPGYCCSQYDDKINVNRTNDVWMFINLDYGRNNRFIGSEYNEFGYPTNVIMGSPLGNAFATVIDMNNAQISYSCRPSNYY